MLIKLFKRPKPQSGWVVHVDAALRYKAGKTGLGAIVYDNTGKVCHTWRVGLEKLFSSNEAEYLAAIWALKKLLRIGILRLVVYSDSKVMVDQMNGLANVNAERLKPLYEELNQLVKGFISIRFHHIHREFNRMADALANTGVDELVFSSEKTKVLP